MKELAKILNILKNEEEILKFFTEILTKSEISTLSKRWRILKMLFQNATQREIAKTLNVGLCKVTRGVKIIQDKNAIVTKFLLKKKQDKK